MGGTNHSPNNVIVVDFKAKRIASKRPDSNPFAMFVDEHCLDPEAFDKALLSSKTSTGDTILPDTGACDV